MQIKIKTQDTEIEYSDEYSKLEPNTAETLFKLVDKIREKQRCQYCGGISTDTQTIRTTAPPEHLDQYIKQRSEWDRTVQR
jgi:hypothetical protein